MLPDVRGAAQLPRGAVKGVQKTCGHGGARRVAVA